MPTNSPWCRAGLGYVVNSMMLVFQVIGRLGSNSVSTSLRERRSSAIFPKRCNAGDQAASSELGLPGRWLGAGSAGRGVFLGWSAGAVAWGLAVPVGEAWEIGTPGALPSPGVL